MSCGRVTPSLATIDHRHKGGRVPGGVPAICSCRHTRQLGVSTRLAHKLRTRRDQVREVGVDLVHRADRFPDSLVAEVGVPVEFEPTLEVPWNIVSGGTVFGVFVTERLP